MERCHSNLKALYQKAKQRYPECNGIRFVSKYDVVNWITDKRVTKIEVKENLVKTIIKH